MNRVKIGNKYTDKEYLAKLLSLKTYSAATNEELTDIYFFEDRSDVESPYYYAQVVYGKYDVYFKRDEIYWK